jgi:hypothetical protein
MSPVRIYTYLAGRVTREHNLDCSPAVSRGLDMNQASSLSHANHDGDRSGRKARSAFAVHARIPDNGRNEIFYGFLPEAPDHASAGSDREAR